VRLRAAVLAFGVFVTVLEGITHPHATPVMTFTGIAGVHVGLVATAEHIRWLNLPCIALLLGVAATQLRTFRRSCRDDDHHRTAGTA
jgi:hypothetical protein